MQSRSGQFGGLTGGAGDASVDHVENSGADDDQSGVEEHALLVIGVGVAEEETGDDVDEQADEGEGVGRDSLVKARGRGQSCTTATC